MTVAPTTLRQLGLYWTRQGGINLGIVGDSAHQARPSYHNGQDVIRANGWTAADDYSIRQPRDREPALTNAASAIDLGRLDDSFKGLRDFSNWLVSRCQAMAPGASDVREIIYSPDGITVQRWSGLDNQIHTGPGNGDLGHRTHTHISYFRDSENRDKRPLFAPFFEDTANEDDDMLAFSLDPSKPHHGIARIAGAGFQAIFLDTGELVGVQEGEDKEHIGFGKLEKPYGSGSGAQSDRQTGWLLYGPRPAWLLAYAGREIPVPSIPDAIAANNERKRADMHAAVDEVYA